MCTSIVSNVINHIFTRRRFLYAQWENVNVMLEYVLTKGFCKFALPLVDNDENTKSGLPRSGKNIWKMNFFPGQGKVRQFRGWSGKFKKDLESQ